MIIKREVLFISILLSVIIFLFYFSSLALAATNSTNSTNASGDSGDIDDTTTPQNLSGFDKSYKCLEDQVKAKGVSSLTTEELYFSLLALGYKSNMKTEIFDELEKRGKDSECWPKESCTLKDTSLVLLAYNHINKNTDKIKSWLLNQTTNTKDLAWYLEIDTGTDASCSLTYDNMVKKINVKADKTISGSPGSCFRLAYNSYWLEIDESCYNKNIEISCDNDFLTTTIYKKKSDIVYYVSTKTSTSSPNGKTSEKVESRCFKQGTSNSCNYEGSLWASISLQKKSEDISIYLPYIMTLASSNEFIFPSSLLYSLTGFDQYYTDIVNKQNIKGYWQISDARKRYSDTALALFSLSGKSSEPADKAIDYLLSPSVQGEGCWNGNNIKDTAFLVFAASPKLASSDSGTPLSKCKDFSGYSCLSQTECENLEGNELPNFYCFGGEICCDKKVTEKTCSEKSGKKCLSTEKCTGTFSSASDTSFCCIDGDCEEEQQVQDTCTSEGYTCKSSCSLSNNEEEKYGYTCPESGICCGEKIAEPKSYWWIVLLIILIILLILAIIFRNQLKVWFFRVKNKFSKSPPAQSTQRPFPPMPPQGMGYGPRRIIPRMPLGARPMPGQGMPRPMQRPPFPKDKELDDTLKKLKDMSK